MKSTRLKSALQSTFEFAHTELRSQRQPEGRFAEVTEKKATGATYTPLEIAQYLSRELILASPEICSKKEISVLDPAIGDGALAVSLINELVRETTAHLRIVGYDTNSVEAEKAKRALSVQGTRVSVDVRERDFLVDASRDCFDLAIANPPYVRTQIMGTEKAGALAERFGLEGRVDLYQAFTLAMIDRLVPNGALALITSNRFLTTKGSAAYRDAIRRKLDVVRVWDLGDTKVFDAAVLPAMLIGRKCEQRANAARFTSVYEIKEITPSRKESLTSALEMAGDILIGERAFTVCQGQLSAKAGDVWRLSSPSVDGWLKRVNSSTWKQLGEVGKIRVGVKTTADKVFIRDDWNSLKTGLPELLRPLTTHHIAERYCAKSPVKQILYPHANVNGHREVVDLRSYPIAAAYLSEHREVLEARKYVIEAGRKWYEIWVPQEPELWKSPKIIFRDIVEKPTFWIDYSGSVVNGDCYWMVPTHTGNEQILLLALAVANSTFIETFYDRRFNNKLYAGRRRFMSQYVEQFPLPNPATRAGSELIGLARRRYEAVALAEKQSLELAMDGLVWEAFGVARD